MRCRFWLVLGIAIGILVGRACGPTRVDYYRIGPADAKGPPPTPLSI